MERKASTQNAMLSINPVLSVTPILGAKTSCLSLLLPALMGVSGKEQSNWHWDQSLVFELDYYPYQVQVCGLARKKATEREIRPE
jgi:hypothetical protein